MSHFTDFLSVLALAIPPVGGIIVAEYGGAPYARTPGTPPREAQTPLRHPRRPGCRCPWSSGPSAFCVGKFYDGGIPAPNSLLTAFVLYSVLGLAG